MAISVKKAGSQVKFLKFIFFLLCLLIPFENTSLRSIAGVFTAPGAILIIPVFLLCAVANFKQINLFEKKVLLYSFLFFVYSLLVSLTFSVRYDYLFVLDRGIRFLLLIMPSIVVFLVVLRQKEDTINVGVLLIGFVCGLSLVINLIAPDIVNTQSFIQYSNALSPHRMRGFTLEASTFGFQIIVVMLLCFIVFGIKLTFAIPFLIIVASLTVSKGTLGCLLLSLLLYLFFLVKSPAKYFFGILILTALPIIFSDNIYSMFASDIENYSSVATRGTMLVTSILILLKYPFGAGFFGYLPSIYENGLSGISIYQRIFPVKLNFHEVLNYFVAGATEGISTKTFFFDWIIFAGFPFVIMFVMFHAFVIKRLSAHKKHLEIVCLLFLSTSLMTFVPLEGRYIAPFAYGFLFLKSQSLVKLDSINTIEEPSKFFHFRKIVW